MFLAKTTIFDLRHDWMGTQNGIDFLMANPENDSYITLKGNHRRNFKAARHVAAHLKTLPEATQDVGENCPELVKQYAVAVAFARAVVKRNAAAYNALPEDAPFVLLDVSDWLKSHGGADAAKRVYKHTAKSEKKPKPYALTHRDTAERGNGYTQYMSASSNICLMSVEQFEALEQAVRQAITQSDMTRDEYFGAAGMLLSTLLQVHQVLPDASLELFDYASNRMAVSTSKCRIEMTVNGIDLIDLDVSMGVRSRAFSDLNVYMEPLVLSEGMLYRRIMQVNEPMMSVYDALTELSESTKKKAA